MVGWREREGPNGKKQEYDWRRFENTVRQYSPKTVVFSDIGPDIRWVGNENGIGGLPIGIISIRLALSGGSALRRMIR